MGRRAKGHLTSVAVLAGFGKAMSSCRFCLGALVAFVMVVVLACGALVNEC
jgi:hypothetical protein